MRNMISFISAWVAFSFATLPLSPMVSYATEGSAVEQRAFTAGERSHSIFRPVSERGLSLEGNAGGESDAEVGHGYSRTAATAHLNLEHPTLGETRSGSAGFAPGAKTSVGADSQSLIARLNTPNWSFQQAA